MKQDTLKNYVEDNTDDEGVIDYSSVLKAINGETGSLIDSKVNAATKNMEEEITGKLFSDLGYENIIDTSTLKDRLDLTKDFDPIKSSEQNSKFDMLNKKLSIYQEGFYGDEDDLELIKIKADKLIAKDESLKYSAAIKEVKVEKESLFGFTVTGNKTNTKVTPSSVVKTGPFDSLYKKYNIDGNK